MRLTLVFLILGMGLVWLGYEEATLYQASSAEPTAMTTDELLDSSRDTANVSVKDYVSFYGDAVYETSAKDSEPRADLPIDRLYYPIVSLRHPLIVSAINADTDEEAEEILNELSDFRAIVMTRRFKRLGDVPLGVHLDETVTGLVVNEIKAIDNDVAVLLRGGLSSIDRESLILIEEGRKPSSVGKLAGCFGGGTLSVLAGIGIAVWNRKRFDV